MPPPGGIITDCLRRPACQANIAIASAQTSKATAPPRRPLTHKIRCCHALWRAMLSPPRLHA